MPVYVYNRSYKLLLVCYPLESYSFFLQIRRLTLSSGQTNQERIISIIFNVYTVVVGLPFACVPLAPCVRAGGILDSKARLAVGAHDKECRTSNYHSDSRNRPAPSKPLEIKAAVKLFSARCTANVSRFCTCGMATASTAPAAQIHNLAFCAIGIAFQVLTPSHLPRCYSNPAEHASAFIFAGQSLWIIAILFLRFSVTR